jgi:hypothetical protein
MGYRYEITMWDIDTGHETSIWMPIWAMCYRHGILVIDVILHCIDMGILMSIWDMGCRCGR